MKKMLFFSLSMAILMVAGLTSCKKDPSPTPPMPNPNEVKIAEKVEWVQGCYFGTEELEGKYLYALGFTALGVMGEKETILKPGNYYRFWLVFDKEPATMRTPPPVGTYKVSQTPDNMTVYIGKRKNGEDFSFVGKFNMQGGFSYGPTPFEDGELVIDENMNATFKGTTVVNERVVHYEMTAINPISKIIGFEELPYLGREPEEKVTKEKTFKVIEFKNEGDKMQNNTTVISAELTDTGKPNSYPMASFIFVLPENTTPTQFPVGIYPINFSAAPNTVLASPGKAGYSSYTWYNETGDVPFYYIVSGTVETTANSVDVRGTSYYGSTINIKYSGDMTIN